MALSYVIPRKSYRAFGLALCAFAAVPLGTGWYYGDALQVKGGAAVMLLGMVLAKAGPQLPPAAAQTALHGTNLLTMVVASLTMPYGSITGTMFMAFALSSVGLAVRNFIAYAVVGLGAALVCVTPYLGAGTSPVPPNVSIFGILGLYALFAIGAVGADRRRSARSAERLLLAGAELRHDHQRLLAGRDALRESRRELEVYSTQLEDQLRRERHTTAQLAAKRSDEQELVRAIHHDLREPLRSIVSFSQLILRTLGARSDAGRAPEFMAFARDGGLRMTRLLDDLRAYTAPLDDQRAPEWVALASVCADVRANLHDFISRSGASVEVGPLPEVRGYPTQLTQLFQNLASNALKFARPGVPPRIRISARVAHEQLQIEVTDNGIGIPPNQLESIFDLFHRVETQAPVEGSGVGLALCKRIALGHGGQLSVRSVPGEGSTFELRLPHYREGARAGATTAAQPTAAHDASPA